MKNSADSNAVPLRLVEDHQFTLLKSPNARMDEITDPAHTRRFSKHLETLAQLLNVAADPSGNYVFFFSSSKLLEPTVQQPDVFGAAEFSRNLKGI
jgi:hypothetical protein